MGVRTLYFVALRLGLLATTLATLTACGEADPLLPPPVDAGPPPVAPRAPDILSFEVSSSSVARGEAVQLTWRADADAVTLRADTSTWTARGGPQGEVQSPALRATTRFILNATRGAGVVIEERLVDVAPTPPAARIDRFAVFPAEFDGAGAEVTLTWRAEGALTLLADGVEVPDFPGAAATFWPIFVDRPTVFTLVAARDGDEVRAEAFVRRSGVELEPNDDRTRAGVLDGDGQARGTISPAQDVDWYAVDVPAGGSVEARVTDDNGGCSFDSQLELWGPDPERPGQIRFLTLSDDVGGELCAHVDPRLDGAALELDTGRYYLSVRGFDARAVGAYRLSVAARRPECGNGLVEVRRGESCDDGNQTDGDGCAASCEVELAADLSGPELTGRIVLETPGWVRLTLIREAILSARARDEQGRCSALEVIVVDPTRSGGDALLALSDPRRSLCGDLDPTRWPAGTYLLAVRGPGAAPVQLDYRIADPGCGDGAVDGGEACDDGNRSSNDGCSSSCTLEAVATSSGASVNVALPDRAPRFVAFDIETPGAGVTATVAAGLGRELRLQLLDDRFRPLIEELPIGAAIQPETVAAADDLPTGRYHVGVRRIVASRAPIALQVNPVAPRCGDGRPQFLAGEGCDDGNAVGGDGCQACQLELTGPPIVLPTLRTELRVGSVPDQGRLLYEVQTSTIVRLASGAAGHPSSFRCDGSAPTDLTLSLLDERLQVIGTGDGGPTGCPRLPPGLRVGPGRYVLAVDRPSQTGLSPVEVTLFGFLARCGDNGLDANEACDDGNVAAGDGCSPSCQWESNAATEQEPNDVLAEAQALGNVIGQGSIQRLAALPPGDVDLFRFEIGRWQEAVVEARTLDPSDRPICLADTALRILDARGRPLAANEDDLTRGRCSRILLDGTGQLREGLYYVEVRPGAQAQSVPIYAVEVDLR